MPPISPVVLWALLLIACSQVRAADLKIDIQGVSAASGTVYAAVFKRAEDFPKAEKAEASAMIEARTPGTTHVFRGLAPGEYAVVAFQDLNGNGRLDRNLVGLPTEPFGFSRDATGLFGPPKFGDAAVRVDAADVAVRINLR